MKKRDLVKFLKAHGWFLIGGSKHEKWTNGRQVTMIPRSREINEYTAKEVMRFVKEMSSENVNQGDHNAD